MAECFRSQFANPAAKSGQGARLYLMVRVSRRPGQSECPNSIANDLPGDGAEDSPGIRGRDVQTC